MTNLVDEHPLVRKADERLADLAKRRADFEARATAVANQDAKAQAEYDKAVNSALLQGTPMPPPLIRQLPAGTDVDIRHNFLMEERRLTDERRQAAAAAYDDVLREARTQARKLVTAARPTLEKLKATHGEVGALLGAVKTCRDAGNNADHFQHFNDSVLTLAELIQIIDAEADPIDAVVDLGGRREVRARAGLVSGGVPQLSR
jgi:hypothetical protein